MREIKALESKNNQVNNSAVPIIEGKYKCCTNEPYGFVCQSINAFCRQQSKLSDSLPQI